MVAVFILALFRSFRYSPCYEYIVEAILFFLLLAAALPIALFRIIFHRQ